MTCSSHSHSIAPLPLLLASCSSSDQIEHIHACIQSHKQTGGTNHTSSYTTLHSNLYTSSTLQPDPPSIKIQGRPYRTERRFSVLALRWWSELPLAVWTAESLAVFTKTKALPLQTGDPGAVRQLRQITGHYFHACPSAIVYYTFLSHVIPKTGFYWKQCLHANNQLDVWPEKVNNAETEVSFQCLKTCTVTVTWYFRNEYWFLAVNYNWTLNWAKNHIW